ncbi:MAG: hypothetical protein QXR91_04520 [Nitrososphaerales archaeon]
MLIGLTEGYINYGVARALAALVLATRSYTVLDRLANAISVDAVNKGVYELARGLEVIMRNPKQGQSITQEGDNIRVNTEWNGERTFIIKGNLPDCRAYDNFLASASKDIKVARQTAAYAATLVASKVSEAVRKGEK